MITQLVVYLIILISKQFKLIAVDLSKEQALEADGKAVQQINFTGNLE